MTEVINMHDNCGDFEFRNYFPFTLILDQSCSFFPINKTDLRSTSKCNFYEYCM